MAEVVVTDLVRSYGEVKALDGVSIRFPDGGLYALLGPSGSGKTTLLRLIAGFDFPTSGAIIIAGQAVENVPVQKREIGMMFQNYALFPNMNVFDNVAFGLTVRRLPKAAIAQRVDEALALVKLSGLEGRKPHQLSGGQRQRVALARAMVTRPRVLLLDEPLSALDQSLRMEMQIELRRIQREVGITTIFVTHDQEEALTLADRIGILDQGRLMQEGAPYDVYHRPNSRFTAMFLGEANLFSGQVEDAGLRLSDGRLLRSNDSLGPVGGRAILAVRPEKISLEADPTAANRLPGQVLQSVFAGSSVTYLVNWQGQTLKVFQQNRGGELLSPGRAVELAWSVSDSVRVE